MIKRWNILGQKGNSNIRKNNNTTWGKKQESTGERRKIKKISRKSKTIQIKQYIPKQRKEILPTSGGGEMTRKHTNNRMQEKPNSFGLKYGNQENITKMPIC